MSVVCCAGRGLCVGLITRPEESYRMWCVSECNLETSTIKRPRPTRGCRALRTENTTTELLLCAGFKASKGFVAISVASCTFCLSVYAIPTGARLSFQAFYLNALDIYLRFVIIFIIFSDSSSIIATVRCFLHAPALRKHICSVSILLICYNADI